MVDKEGIMLGGGVCSCRVCARACVSLCAAISPLIDLRTVQDLRDNKNENRIMEYDIMQRDEGKKKKSSVLLHLALL